MAHPSPHYRYQCARGACASDSCRILSSLGYVGLLVDGGFARWRCDGRPIGGPTRIPGSVPGLGARARAPGAPRRAPRPISRKGCQCSPFARQLATCDAREHLEAVLCGVCPRRGLRGVGAQPPGASPPHRGARACDARPPRALPPSAPGCLGRATLLRVGGTAPPPRAADRDGGRQAHRALRRRRHAEQAARQGDARDARVHAGAAQGGHGGHRRRIGPQEDQGADRRLRDHRLRLRLL